MSAQETPLTDIIRQQIRATGPMNMAEYMSLCLGHPEHGYYMHKDPFGVAGDFTTAPEISQLFGELIGVWVADTWMQMGRPDRFVILECGPGRGALMSDALRATKSVEGFHEAMQVVMLETSPYLKSVQEKTLMGHGALWISALDQLNQEVPVIIIGNELLDALSVRQLQYTDTGWLERCVGLGINDTLSINLKNVEKSLLSYIPPMLIAPKEDDVIEVSVARQAFVQEICKIILNQQGSALFLDYGFIHNVPGETLQAVKNHSYCDILDSPGQVDLTAHVNFAEIARIVMGCDLTVHDAVSQSDFLKRLGAELRAEKLTQNATAQQAQGIKSALQRLIGTDTKAGEMGTLFKAIAFSSDPHINLAGFM